MMGVCVGERLPSGYFIFLWETAKKKPNKKTLNLLKLLVTDATRVSFLNPSVETCDT